MAAREGLRAKEESEIFLEIAEIYADVIRDEDSARIQRQNVRLLMRQVEAANSRFEVGAGTRTDIALAEARLAGAKAGLAQADARLQVSRSRYKAMTGHMPENLQPLPVFVLPVSQEEALRLAFDNNPGLIAALYNEEGVRSSS